LQYSTYFWLIIIQLNKSFLTFKKYDSCYFCKIGIVKKMPKCSFYESLSYKIEKKNLTTLFLGIWIYIYIYIYLINKNLINKSNKKKITDLRKNSWYHLLFPTWIYKWYPLYVSFFRTTLVSSPTLILMYIINELICRATYPNVISNYVFLEPRQKRWGKVVITL